MFPARNRSLLASSTWGMVEESTTPNGGPGAGSQPCAGFLIRGRRRIEPGTAAGILIRGLMATVVYALFVGSGQAKACPPRLRFWSSSCRVRRSRIARWSRTRSASGIGITSGRGCSRRRSRERNRPSLRGFFRSAHAATGAGGRRQERIDGGENAGAPGLEGW